MNNERVLLQQAFCFEEQALAEIYERYSPGIYRYVWRLLGEQNLAEECVSETFSRFLQALQSGHGPQEYLQAYLYRIAHNWVTDFYRRQTPPSLPLDDDIEGSQDEDPSQMVSRSFDLQRVRAALALLTPEQRHVVLLKYFKDMSNDEIARSLNKPISAIKALQHRGLAALRRLLIKHTEVE